MTDEAWEPWPDNLPLGEQLERLTAVLLTHPAAFDRSEGAMEAAARLLSRPAYTPAAVPPNERTAYLLDEVIQHGDENGALANATGDELRDALALSVERIRELVRRWPRPTPRGDAAVTRLREAIRLTREYVGDRVLPAIEGWTWYDAIRATGGLDGFGSCGCVLNPDTHGRTAVGGLRYCGLPAGHDGDHLPSLDE